MDISLIESKVRYVFLWYSFTAFDVLIILNIIIVLNDSN